MGKKITVNIRSNVAAPYGFSYKEIDNLIKTYFDKRGESSVLKSNQKYLITSYRFRNRTAAEIKIKIHYAKEGNMRAFDMLATFETYKNKVIENVNEYRVMLLGFLEYLNNIKFGWFVDVFVFRVYPVDFMRQWESRIGDMVTDVDLILRIKGSDYCIIKGDRLEYRCSDWQSDTIDVIMTIITKYTRK